MCRWGGASPSTRSVQPDYSTPLEVFYSLTATPDCLIMVGLKVPYYTGSSREISMRVGIFRDRFFLVSFFLFLFLFSFFSFFFFFLFSLFFFSLPLSCAWLT